MLRVLGPFLWCVHHFCIHKGIPRENNGKYDIRLFLLLILEGRSHQLNSCTFIGVSGDTHIETILVHMPYGYMAKIWSYGHIAQGSKVSIQTFLSKITDLIQTYFCTRYIPFTDLVKCEIIINQMCNFFIFAKKLR